MPQEAENQNSGAGPPRESYILDSVIIGVGVAAVLLAICGATGLAHSEYRLPPWQDASRWPLGWSGYGAIPGLIAGLSLNLLRRRIKQGKETGKRSRHG